MPPLLFDDEQAVALAVALRIAAAPASGIEEAAARALATVRQVMPARLRTGIDASRSRRRAARRAAPQRRTACSWRSAPPSAPTRCCASTTRDRRARAPPRRVEPHHLVTRRGRWYLVAWDLDRDDWRTFRADRIAPRTPTGPRFAPREVPGGDVGAFVAGRFRGSDGTRPAGRAAAR